MKLKPIPRNSSVVETARRLSPVLWKPIALHPVSANLHPTGGRGYTEAHALAAQLSQPVFDGEYLERLLARDPVAEQQFVRHFGELIRMVVLARTRSGRLVEDVTQETFLRVLQLLRRQGGLERPDRLGSFVYSVCRRVLAEHLRKDRELAQEAPQRTPSYQMLLDESLVRQDRKRTVESALSELSPLERRALRLVFLEERDRSEVCQELGLTPDYLRVILCRGKARLKRALEQAADQGRRLRNFAPRGPSTETGSGSQITDQ
jgi:RNA polymerase sigma-70 factor (ECF subfamily)